MCSCLWKYFVLSQNFPLAEHCWVALGCQNRKNYRRKHRANAQLMCSNYLLYFESIEANIFQWLVFEWWFCQQNPWIKPQTTQVHKLALVKSSRAFLAQFWGLRFDSICQINSHTYNRLTRNKLHFFHISDVQSITLGFRLRKSNFIQLNGRLTFSLWEMVESEIKHTWMDDILQCIVQLWMMLLLELLHSSMFPIVILAIHKTIDSTDTSTDTKCCKYLVAFLQGEKNQLN